MGNFNRDRGSSRGRNFSSRGGSAFGGGRRDFHRGNFDRGGDRGGDRPMHKAICSNCGKECEVPFRPTSGKPVYCSDCFEKMGGRNDRQSSDRPRFEDRKPSFDQNKNQFDALNVKLDKILNLLEPKVAEPVIEEPAAEEKPKVKKIAKKSASTKKK